MTIFSAATLLFLVMSGALSRILGHNVLIAIERLMGMLLVAVAIQMLMTGITHYIVSP